jgi:hypothetical protein
MPPATAPARREARLNPLPAGDTPGASEGQRASLWWSQGRSVAVPQAVAPVPIGGLGCGPVSRTFREHRRGRAPDAIPASGLLEIAHPSRGGAAKPRGSRSQPGCRKECPFHVLGWPALGSGAGPCNGDTTAADGPPAAPAADRRQHRRPGRGPRDPVRRRWQPRTGSAGPPGRPPAGRPGAADRRSDRPRQRQAHPLHRHRLRAQLGAPGAVGQVHHPAPAHLGELAWHLHRPGLDAEGRQGRGAHGHARTREQVRPDGALRELQGRGQRPDRAHCQGQQGEGEGQSRRRPHAVAGPGPGPARPDAKP